jgi:hypothetical protein
MGNVLRVMAGEGLCKTLISRYISLVALMPIMQHGFEQNQALGARKIRTTDANSATQQHVF